MATKSRKQLKEREYHGMVNTPEYNSWRAMIERCTNQNHSQYRDYGERGITVCDRWRFSFLSFLEDMGPRPPGTFIERKENSRGYCPDNCRWTTRVEQGRNKRNNRLLTCRGETKTLAEWVELTGLGSSVILTRINRQKWSVEKAITTPSGASHASHRFVSYAGRTQTLTEWAKELGISRTGLADRLKRFSLEDAMTRPVRQRRR